METIILSIVTFIIIKWFFSPSQTVADHKVETLLNKKPVDMPHNEWVDICRENVLMTLVAEKTKNPNSRNADMLLKAWNKKVAREYQLSF